MSEFFPQLRRRASYLGSSGGSGYRRFRIEVAEDCLKRCFYCDSKQDEIGGDPTMELDHFRPQNDFQQLIDEPTNLVYACRSCNNKKRADWPAGTSAGTHVNGEGYIDGFIVQRSAFFLVQSDGTINARQIPAEYVIKRLALNRPLLKSLRRRAILRAELQQQINSALPKIDAMIQQLPGHRRDLEEIKQILQCQLALNNLC